jgi:hypothetical protein
LLTAGGLGSPLAWAYAFVDDPPDEWEQAAVDYTEGLCGSLPGDGWMSVSAELLTLATVSMRATVSHGKRVAAVSDLQLSVDAVDTTRLRAAASEESDLKRLQVYSPDGDLPTAWRPVKYRRRALAATEHERESEERLQRKRRVVQVLEVLREAGLPFAASVASADDVTPSVLARCCQGLAANTLAKRLRDWHQFRRHPVLEGIVPPYPRGESDVLDYLGLRAVEQAPKSCFADLVSALRFM